MWHLRSPWQCRAGSSTRCPPLAPCHLSIPGASPPGWTHHRCMGCFGVPVHPSVLPGWVRAVGPGGLRQPAEHRGRGIWAMSACRPPQSRQGRQLSWGLAQGRPHGGRDRQKQSLEGRPVSLHCTKHCQHRAPPWLAGVTLWTGWPRCRACGRAMGKGLPVPHTSQLLGCLEHEARVQQPPPRPRCRQRFPPLPSDSLTDEKMRVLLPATAAAASTPACTAGDAGQRTQPALSHPCARGRLGFTGFWPLSVPFSQAVPQGSRMKPQFRRKPPQLSAHKQPGAQLCVFMTTVCVLRCCPVPSTVPLVCAARGTTPASSLGTFGEGWDGIPQTQVPAVPRQQTPGEATRAGPGCVAGSSSEPETASSVSPCAGSTGRETGPVPPGCKHGARGKAAVSRRSAVALGCGSPGSQGTAGSTHTSIFVR